MSNNADAKNSTLCTVTEKQCNAVSTNEPRAYGSKMLLMLFKFKETSLFRLKPLNMVILDF